jgi:signal transduction histidine kinase
VTPHKDNVVAAIARARAELDQALGELARLPAFDPGVVGFTAHALGNFLTVTDGTVELLIRALGDYPDPNVHNWLEGLRQVTHLMMHSANQLVTASVSGNSRLVFSEVDLVVLVRRACDYYQRGADRKQIRIEFEAPPELPAVWTSRVGAAAVLDNLVSNAVKYSPPGKRVRVRLRAEPDGVVCSVQDEGPGLTAVEQAKLFQRGVTLGAVPTGGESSTGFGLAVARELVGQLGGTIRCESQHGQGATFSFRLPLAGAGRGGQSASP